MYDIEQKLYHDLNLKIEVPESCEKAIREGLHKKKKHYSWMKIITTACASLMLTAGVVYAGTKIYEKIWGNPERVVGYYSEENNIKEEITNDTMKEDEAKELAEELLKKFQQEKESIKSAELIGNPIDYELAWNIETNENTDIFIDAKNKNSYSIVFNNIEMTDVQTVEDNKLNEKAKIIAKSICEKLGYMVEKYNYIKVQPIIEMQNGDHVACIEFFKQYDGLTNPYEKISIRFILETSQINAFTISDTKCEDNNITITEAEAKNIVNYQEEKIKTKYKINDIKAEKAIVATNGDAYLRISDYEQYRKQSIAQYPAEKIVDYRIERRIRKVWAVTVNYDVPEKDKFNGDFVACDEHYTYFIDGTTGEVVGGSNDFESIKNYMY